MAQSSYRAKIVRIEGNTAWCSKCKLYLPLEQFHKNAANEHGLQYWCNSCRHEKAKEVYARSQGAAAYQLKREALRTRQAKICPVCRLNKASEEFPRAKQYPDGRGSVCKFCCNRSMRKKRAEGRHNYGPALRWMRENKEKVRASASKRVAKRQALKVEDVDFKMILEKHGMVCHICGLTVDTFSDVHFDHVIPLSRGGEHTESNILPAHSKCNLRKGKKLLIDFFPRWVEDAYAAL